MFQQKPVVNQETLLPKTDRGTIPPKIWVINAGIIIIKQRLEVGLVTGGGGDGQSTELLVELVMSEESNLLALAVADEIAWT